MGYKEDAIKWFKSNFGNQIAVATANTPFSLNLLTAIAMQETYYIWGGLYKKLPMDQVLKHCVGDTIGSPRRKAFPKTKEELLADPKGKEMFQIAREALESLGTYLSEFQKTAKNPNKFCHGFGIFQYDIQFFRTNPDFFLQKQWYSFDVCLKMCVNELKEALKCAYGNNKTSLTDEEMVYVAIAYNSGSVKFKPDFKEGHKGKSEKYYGEYIWEYLKLSKSISF